MKTPTPVVRDVAWLSTLPQFIVLGSLMVGSVIIGWTRYGYLSVMGGVATYLAYSYGSRAFLLTHHRQGRRLTDQHRYQEAIQAFENSHEFFAKHPWIDQFRALTMMTPAKLSFREMALLNIAYCYGQMGDKAQTIAGYQRTLSEFPDSHIARTALKFIETVETPG